MGAPRSGTSAVTRVLSLCGAALPTGMAGADRNNPRGYWEPRASLHINNSILHRNGSTTFDTSLHLQDEGGFDAQEKARCVAEIGSFLSTLPAAPLVVIKDPRITLLSGLWFEAARTAGFDVAAVIPVRHPQEVIASGAAALLTAPDLATALWLKFNLLSERDTRGLPRVFVDYASFLEDWRREIKRISVALAIDLDARDEGAIEEFLTPDLHRQQHGGAVTEPFGTDWISVTYDALCAATRDEPWDQATLDRVLEAYRASERGYRAVFENAQQLHKIYRFMPPRFLKLRNGIVAMAHRRRGTWA
ncbi:hypothetical protein A5707_21000 [Mycobacterium kyorinense]|uniref:Sulfotransferase family protein n=1 Tax=Mycobacterium kyorinense TaxID=487514 RepID=A0A1A2ZA72_9MYCO|nr:sulfotransferase family protein [Mycobacterium kyorinense]OBI46553.1 hypothetical protein A5707_21000 [Mycobacterium kyorinense]